MTAGTGSSFAEAAGALVRIEGTRHEGLLAALGANACCSHRAWKCKSAAPRRMSPLRLRTFGHPAALVGTMAGNALGILYDLFACADILFAYQRDIAIVLGREFAPASPEQHSPRPRLPHSTRSRICSESFPRSSRNVGGNGHARRDGDVTRAAGRFDRRSRRRRRRSCGRRAARTVHEHERRTASTSVSLPAA